MATVVTKSRMSAPASSCLRLPHCLLFTPSFPFLILKHCMQDTLLPRLVNIGDIDGGLWKESPNSVHHCHISNVVERKGEMEYVNHQVTPNYGQHS